MTASENPDDSAPAQAPLTHFGPQGESRMVDVSHKPASTREAIARGRVVMQPATLQRILDRQVEKGDVLEVARLAGIMAAKQTPSLIPLCHPLPLSKVEITWTPENDHTLLGQARCKVVGQTGVEMEALTAISVALLTIYDMCKAVDRDMTLTDICLQHKSGGKSGRFDRSESP